MRSASDTRANKKNYHPSRFNSSTTEGSIWLTPIHVLSISLIELELQVWVCCCHRSERFLCFGVTLADIDGVNFRAEP